jgi:hypothetical protein
MTQKDDDYSVKKKELDPQQQHVLRDHGTGIAPNAAAISAMSSLMGQSPRASAIA